MAIKVEKFSNATRIVLTPNLKKVVYFTYLGLGVLFFVFSVFCLFVLLVLDRQSLASVLFFPVFLVIGYNMLRRVFEREIVTLFSEKMRIRKTFSLKGIKEYCYHEIKNLRIESESNVSHELEGKSFDHFGIGNESRNVSNIAAQGNITFDWKFRAVRFGQDLYNEDLDFVFRLISTRQAQSTRSFKSKRSDPSSFKS